jgi:ribosomal protein S18 acetylase RimI-like enzyme
MLEPTFQQAQPEDVEKLLPFIEAYYQFDGIPFKAAETRGSLGALLSNPSLGRVWIVHAENQPVGYVILTFGYDLEFGGLVATVTELYIATAHRRHGIGTQLIQFVETTSRDLGITALELQVEQDNVEAQAFYRALGFNAHARIPLSKRLRQTTE